MTCLHARTQDHDGIRWCDDCRAVVNPWPGTCLACGLELPSVGRTLAYHACDPSHRLLHTPGGIALIEHGPPVYVRGMEHVCGSYDGKALTPHRGPLRGKRLSVPEGMLCRWADLNLEPVQGT